MAADAHRPRSAAALAPLDVFACPLAGLNLIEASAGTGKTWNICGLYLRLLLERGLAVQQILVVTFTNAATAELRERIRARLAETLARLRGGPAAGDPFVDILLATLHGQGAEDTMLEERLELALQTFDEAAIFTIHGFCQRALADAPFAAGLPFKLELLTNDRELRQQVARDFWRRRVASAALSPALAEALAEKGDSPERWAAQLRQRLAKPLARLVWPEGIAAPPTDESAAVAEAFVHAARVWRHDEAGIAATIDAGLGGLNARSYNAAKIAEALQAWRSAVASGIAPELAGRKAGVARLLCAGVIAAATKKNATSPEHEFFDAAQGLLDAQATQSEARRLQRAALLREWLEAGPAALRDAKRERRVVAFDDMLANLHARLVGEGGADLVAALRERFPAALIDEFQDTDPLQFAIFAAIYSGATDAAGDPLPAFMVGDPKQAIYSFRNADLETYFAARGEAQAQYTLAANQRSSSELIAALNALFGANPRAFVREGLDYHAAQVGARARKPFADRSAPRAALQLWELPADKDGSPAMKAPLTDATVAACAGEIARLLAAARAGEVSIGDRPLAAGDIAVLVRSHRQGSLMRGALAGLGVGSVELAQASVFASTDAEDLERLLLAVFEPGREALVRAALATSLLGFEAAAIEALGSDEVGWLAQLADFQRYRELWLARGVGVMLRQLLRERGVAARLLARADGERRLTNLLHLAECLHEAAQHHAAPEALLRWLAEQRSAEAGDGDEASQLRLESDQNLVQIVTVHKSKGLEYPVVFCPFLWQGRRGGGAASLEGQTIEGREYHDAAGELLLDFSEPDDEDIKHRLRRAEFAELLRLIYVALTRAVHRCYLVVGCYSAKAGFGVSTKESQRTPLNWLAAGAGVTPEDWLQAKDPVATPGDIAAAWRALAAAEPAAVELSPLPTEAVPALAPERPEPARIAALPTPAHLPAPWVMASYSSLVHGAAREAAARDHDGRAAPQATPAEAAAAPAADDILRFPRGSQAGDVLHAIFEVVDFADPSGWDAAATRAITRHLPPASATQEAAWRRMARTMLGDVFATPLTPAGWTLAQVPAARRLAELEFSLPVDGFAPAALAELLRRHGVSAPALSGARLAGMLRGFIDLVFQAGGRYWLLDWKSNHLGDTPEAYGTAPVERAMEAHGYHLQYLIYTVALHRYLAQRVAGYDYDTHFGGALYLFVRGVRPGWVVDGAPAGVFSARPARELVEAISALLGDVREAA